MIDESGNPAKIDKLEVHAYKIPTDQPESDGTLQWDSTTMVAVFINAAGETGFGYTYADVSAASFIRNNFREIAVGQNPLDIEKIVYKAHRSIRNNGNCGIAFMALSALDVALWDLKAKLLSISLAELLGRAQNDVLVYGSGGFTSYSDEKLSEQLGNWSGQGFTQVKIKIGRDPAKDLRRLQVARDAISPDTALFVDANGAYTIQQALKMAEEFAKYNVQWYEEPVSSDNLKGLAFVRDHCPAGNQVAAGEYGFGLPYFRNMLENHAVDVLQADATRCGGISGFLKAGRLAEAFQVPFSFHCAPSLHIHAAVALPGFFTGEYFHDHVRIEKMLLDGFREPVNGRIAPDTGRPGLGLDFKHADAEKYKIE